MLRVRAQGTSGRTNRSRSNLGRTFHGRRLRVEPLEDRRLLAVITVDTLIDENDGVGVGAISLRDAIAAANPGDTIDFDPALTSGGPASIVLEHGELLVTKNLTIDGPGPDLLTIDASGSDATPGVMAGDGSRVFNVDNSSVISQLNVSIRGLRLTGGDTPSNGGAIRNFEHLALDRVAVEDNGAQLDGGGIYTRTGSLTVTFSTISGNSTVTSGGGIARYFGNVTISSSTISGNSAYVDGGGIATSGNSGSMSILHSTIAANRADANDNNNGNGGGVFAVGVDPTLDHTIVADNFSRPTMRSDIHGDVALRFSLIGVNASVGFTNNGGNIVGTAAVPVDAKLAPLAHNGGPTQTHALLFGSPAIETGDPAAIAGVGAVPQFDQRGSGYARVRDGDASGVPRIDMGAIEASSVIVVDSLADENDGDFSANDLTLREAISLANASSDPTSITFSPTLFVGGAATIVLSLGELPIVYSASITGPGADLLTIDASGNDLMPSLDNGDGSRVFAIDGASATLIEVELVGLAITGGDALGPGGAIFNKDRLAISECTITGNHSNDDGGAVYSRLGTTTITSSEFRDNSSLGDGGALYLAESIDPDAIVKCFIDGNTAGGNGGAIATDSELSIDVTTLSDNASASNGGAIAIADGAQVSIAFSTLSDNSAGEHGGGVFGVGSSLRLESSTISGNSADGLGGGVYLSGGAGQDSSIVHSTIADNRSDADNSDTSATGGGIYANVAPSSLPLSHSIVAANIGGSSANDDIVGAASARYTLIGVGNQAVITDNGGNLIGTTSSPIEPLLDALSDNDGPTQTHALLEGSPAIDAGDPTVMEGLNGIPATDQRGLPYHRVIDDDGVGGARIDMGSFERQELPPTNLIVDTLADELDGDYAPGDLSLREAIAFANMRPGIDEITFAPESIESGPGTILLTMGELLITQGVTIVGLGMNVLTIDASGNDPTPGIKNGDGSRIFNLVGTVEICGLTLTGGDAPGRGGAIRGSSQLTIRESRITGNSASFDSLADKPRGGGGISNVGPLYVVDSDVSGNLSRADSGGGISASGIVEIVRSKVNNNSLPDGSIGGGIYVNGHLVLRESEVSGNTLQSDNGYARGGGVAAGSATIVDSTVTNNHVAQKFNQPGLPAAFGGGVSIHGEVNSSVSISGSVISGNSVTSNNTGTGYGGGLQLNSATTEILNSSIRDNTASGFGGGVAVIAGSINVTASEIANNSAGSDGGGLWAFTVEDSAIQKSTVSGNSTAGDGGGLYLVSFYGTTTSVVQSTISGNSADGDGGAIWGYSDSGSRIRIAHSTITKNTSDSESNGSGAGGGVFNGELVFNGVPTGVFGMFELDHSIVAENVDNTGAAPDVRDSTLTNVEAAYSLIGDRSGSGLVEAPVGSPDANGNLIGGATNGVIDALLGPLVNNGSSTLTHALLPGSPALNAGDPTISGAPMFDQRGEPWVRIAGGQIDIGAVEQQANPLPGDYNFDGIVDAVDYTMWRNTVGSMSDFRADGSGPTFGVPDGVVDALDYAFWKANYGNTLAPGNGGLASMEADASESLSRGLQPSNEPVGAPIRFVPFASSPSATRAPADAAWQRIDEVNEVSTPLLAWYSSTAGTLSVDEPFDGSATDVREHARESAARDSAFQLLGEPRADLLELF